MFKSKILNPSKTSLLASTKYSDLFVDCTKNMIVIKYKIRQVKKVLLLMLYCKVLLYFVSSQSLNFELLKFLVVSGENWLIS